MPFAYPVQADRMFLPCSEYDLILKRAMGPAFRVFAMDSRRERAPEKACMENDFSQTHVPGNSATACRP